MLAVEEIKCSSLGLGVSGLGNKCPGPALMIMTSLSSTIIPIRYTQVTNSIKQNEHSA